MTKGAGREDFQRVWLFFALVLLLSWGVGGVYLLFPKPLTAAFGPFAYVRRPITWPPTRRPWQPWA